MSGPSSSRLTEFDILKAKHKYVYVLFIHTVEDLTSLRFLREDDNEEAGLSWEDKLAQKYYSSLYREYAVCDLKHYKSGNVRYMLPPSSRIRGLTTTSDSSRSVGEQRKKSFPAQAKAPVVIHAVRCITHVTSTRTTLRHR